MSENYELIEVDLSDEDKIVLIERFIATKLSGASQRTYLVELEKDDTCVEDALFQAILNEMVLQVLIDEIESRKEEPSRVFMTENEIQRMTNVTSNLC